VSFPRKEGIHSVSLAVKDARMSSEQHPKCESPRSVKGRILWHIYAEAEYALKFTNVWNYAETWAPPAPPRPRTKYDAPETDVFRIGHIWGYLITQTMVCLICTAAISVVLWLPPARYTLSVGAFYAGVVFSFLSTMAYLTSRRRLRRHLQDNSPDEATGARRFLKIESLILTPLLLLLGFLQMFLVPYGMFVFHFIFWYSAYSFTVVAIYLAMRYKDKSWVGGCTLRSAGKSPEAPGTSASSTERTS